jgi:hypothetical protein
MTKTLTLTPVTANGEAVKNLSLINPRDWANFLADNTAPIAMARAYQDVGWFRAAMDTRANAVIACPWEITTPGGADPIWDSTMEDVPPKLKPLANLSSTLFQAALSLLTDGGAWFKINADNGKFQGLQYLAPSTVEPKVSEQMGLIAWERIINGVRKPLALEEVLYIGVANPFQELPVKSEERMSEGRAALRHADVLYEIDLFTRGELKRGLLKPTAAYVPPGTPEKEINRIKAWLQDKFGGAKNAGNFGILEAGGLELKVLGNGISDLSPRELIDLHREGVATALRVKMSMLQSKDAANRSVSEQDVRSFYTDVVIPDLRRIERAYNGQLLNGMGLALKFHPERLEAFQNGELDKADKVVALFESQLTTRNESRAPIDGLDPVEGPEGDEYYQAPASITFPTNGKSTTLHKLRPFASG